MRPDDITLTRRHVIAALAVLVVDAPLDAAAPLTTIEQRYGVRIGAVLRAADGQILFAHRPDERVLFCSTFKVFLVGAVLKMAQANPALLLRRIAMRADRKLGNSPVTGRRPTGSSLSVEELCAAAIEYSDNSAANYLLDVVGGPPAVTHLFRQLGDPVSRLDRNEPTLNTVAPGDPRDTTTPAAVTHSLGRLLLDAGALDQTHRNRLLRWMENEHNGVRRIRAGMPATWTVANKPGTNDAGAINDIAVVGTPSGRSFLMSVYVSAPDAEISRGEVIIAQVAQILADRAKRALVPAHRVG